MIHDLSVTELARAVRRTELSPVEIADHYLDRIDHLNDSVGAYVTVTPEMAREQAKRAEQAVTGAADPGDLPPLIGVPVPVKDLNLVKDVPVTFGSATYANFIAPVDDSVVESLRAAGTVLLGKTNTPEFGPTCYTENSVAPPARTPWDPSRSAGGSSGGAAAAVAAGLAPAAHASDGAGSIRIPASVCGLFGIKPSRGRISHAPIVPDLVGLGTDGPIARTVADAALLLDAMISHQPGDMYAVPDPAAPFAEAARRDPGRLRIARTAAPAVPGVEVDAEVVAAYDAASRLLESLGHEVIDIAPPFGPDIVPAFEKLWYAHSCMHPVEPGKEHLLRPITAWLRRQGDATTAPEFLRAHAQLQVAMRLALLVTNEYDAVLTPTVASPPVPVGWFEDGVEPPETFRRMMAFAPFPAIYNVTGQPAVNLPGHWTPDGLPIGVMLGGRMGEEELLISLSAQLEAERPFWGDRRPEIW